MNCQRYGNKRGNSNASSTTTVLGSSQLLSYKSRNCGDYLKHHVYLWTFFVVMA